jgi:outer membrane lipoprotein-sorting protein
VSPRLIPSGGRLLVLAAAVVATTLASAAEPQAPARPTPTVDQIVAKYIEARGGLDKIRSIKTLREKGRLTSGADRQALVTRELKRPGHTRFEITVQGVTGVFVSDGRQGWKMSPFDGDTEPRPLPEEVVNDAAEQADIEGPLVDWKVKGHRVELAGVEQVEGHDAWKIKMTLKSGVVRYEYIDSKTSYRVRTDTTRLLHGRAMQVTMTFGDYKKVGGTLFPQLIEITSADRPQKLRVVVDQIEVNPPLAEDRFAMVVPSQP